MKTTTKVKGILFCMAMLAFFPVARAQEKLSLQEAISIALKNNYDIRLINNEAAIAKNNANPGNAGLLPALTANYANGGSRQNSVQTPATGEERRINGARNTNQSYGVALDWTVFDGFQMFANYERLKELQKLGEVNAKSTILATIADVINGYYAVVRQQELVVATDTALDISRLRITIAQNKLSIGRGSRLDVLAATVDYNADTSLYLQQKNQLRNNIVLLNQVMARDVTIEFRATDSISIDRSLSYTDMATQAEQLSPILQAAFINKKVAELNLKQVKGQRYPIVGVNSGYEFSKSTSPTGFNQQFRANGFTYGLTASLPLFNGFLQRQNERNAKINISSSSLNLEKTRTDLHAQLLSAYQNYTTNLDLLKVEDNNVDIARQNLDITLEKYRLGSIAPLELREAQRNSIDAITRFLDAEYQAKLTEISLKEISGTLNIQ
ncbi:outer membrane efflux protein [Pedobacter sp. BAL39]|uniref:TolC family protein n=1 Tax=Pedobacter sp. BAL39 TaxID=391596 RepID=UPI0001559AC5|nr:TolC family protein [Pedobacter sp. BAL39]EDM36988.1 outer membrane efflux protein [Pedobacter sp. BAL39]